MYMHIYINIHIYCILCIYLQSMYTLYVCTETFEFHTHTCIFVCNIFCKIHIHICMYGICIYIHIYTHSCVYICMYIITCTDIHTYIRTYTYMCVCVHKYIYTYISSGWTPLFVSVWSSFFTAGSQIPEWERSLRLSCREVAVHAGNVQTCFCSCLWWSDDVISLSSNWFIEQHWTMINCFVFFQSWRCSNAVDKSNTIGRSRGVKNDSGRKFPWVWEKWSVSRLWLFVSQWLTWWNVSRPSSRCVTSSKEVKIFILGWRSQRATSPPSTEHTLEIKRTQWSFSNR